MVRLVHEVTANDDSTLDVVFKDGEVRRYDVKALLGCEAFASLSGINAFKKVRNGGYFIEWENEADSSADTLFLEGAPK